MTSARRPACRRASFPAHRGASNTRSSCSLALAQVVQVGALVEKIGRQVGDHLRIAAAVVAQIEDDGVDVAEEVHRRRRRRPADVRIGEGVELHVADVRRPAARPSRSRSSCAPSGDASRPWGPSERGLWATGGVETDAQMLSWLTSRRSAVSFSAKASPLMMESYSPSFCRARMGVHHLFRGIGEYVELVQFGDDAVDRALAGRGVDLKSASVSRRDCSQPKKRPRRIGVLDVELSDARRSLLLLHAELDVRPLALVNAEQIESAGLVAEVHLTVDGPRRIIFLNVGFDPRPVPTVERFKPSLQRPPCRGIRECRLSGCPEGERHTESNASQQHGCMDAFAADKFRVRRQDIRARGGRSTDRFKAVER